jgi:hypothetical protein
MSRRNLFVIVGVLLALAMWTSFGCQQGPQTGSLRGTVTLKGKPFSNARLNFIHEKTKSAAGAEINPDGSFTVEKLEVGTYVVFLAPRSERTPDNPEAEPGIDPNVPPDCYDQSKSPLRVEIKPGANTKTLELAP